MPSFRSFALPALACLLTLSFTGFAWLQLHNQHNTARQDRFDTLSNQAHELLQQQLDHSLRLLHSAQAHYASSNTPRLGNFLMPQLSQVGLAGLHRLSHAPLVLPEQLETLTASQPAGFLLRPQGNRPLYAPVIDALGAANRFPAEAGQDLFADPDHQRTLTLARDAGAPTLSGPLPLQSGHDAQIPGFIIAAPLFARDQPHASVAERRTHLQGWLVASYNTQEWVRETLGPLAQELDIVITDSAKNSPGSRLYPIANEKPIEAAAGLARHSTLQLGDEGWQLQIKALPELLTRVGSDPAKPVALLGLTLAAALFYMGMQLSLGKRRHANEAERLQDALHEAEERWRFALEGSGDGVWDWDIKTGQVSFSPRCDTILGVADGHANQAKIHPEDEAAERSAMQACLEGKSSQYVSEHRMQGEDGQWRWVAARGMVVARAINGAAARMIGTISDITERKTANERIQGMAQVDAQTGLPNRTLFFDRLQQALRMAKRKRETLGLICVDIDNFKSVNDNFGQTVGNTLLRAAADRLNETVRDSDTVAHFGSDNFSILLPTLASDDDAHLVTEKLLKAFASDFIINNRHISLSISIGMALFPQHARSAETLLNGAQRAVQQATKSGGGTVCFSLNAGK